MDIFNEIRLGIVDGTPRGWWIEEITIKPVSSGVYVYARSETHCIELALPLGVFIKNKDMIRGIVKEEVQVAVENVLAK